MVATGFVKLWAEISRSIVAPWNAKIAGCVINFEICSDTFVSVTSGWHVTTKKLALGLTFQISRLCFDEPL